MKLDLCDRVQAVTFAYESGHIRAGSSLTPRRSLDETITRNLDRQDGAVSRVGFTLSKRCGQPFVRDEVRNLTFGLAAEGLSEHQPGMIVARACSSVDRASASGA